MTSIKDIKFLDVNLSDRFDRQLREAPDEIIAAFFDAYYLFLEEPDHPVLRNHLLTAKFAGYRSIDVTEDWRALFKETRVGERIVITFHLLGTHEALYG